MSSLLLIFCCLFGLGSAWNQPSTCYVRSSSGTETELTKIRESLEYLSELEHIREALETIADRLMDAEGNASAPVSTTSMPTATTSTTEAATATTSEPTATTSTTEATTATTSEPTATTSTTEATTVTTSEPTAMTTDPPTGTASDTCGGPGWTRVAYINMTDPNQQLMPSRTSPDRLFEKIMWSFCVNSLLICHVSSGWCPI